MLAPIVQRDDALRSKQHPEPLSTPALEREANRRCARRVIGLGHASGASLRGPHRMLTVRQRRRLDQSASVVVFPPRSRDSTPSEVRVIVRSGGRLARRYGTITTSNGPVPRRRRMYCASSNFLPVACLYSSASRVGCQKCFHPVTVACCDLSATMKTSKSTPHWPLKPRRVTPGAKA